MSDAMQFAECRALGHAWRHRGTVGGDDSKHRPPHSIATGVVGKISRCSACKCIRVKWITRSGEIINRYEYPDGYQQRGDDTLTPRQWRSTYVASIFDEFTHMEAAS